MRCGTDCILASADDSDAEPTVAETQSSGDLDTASLDFTGRSAVSANPFQPPTHQGVSVTDRTSGILDNADRVGILVRLQAPAVLLATFATLMICLGVVAVIFVAFISPGLSPDLPNEMRMRVLGGIVFLISFLGYMVITLIGALKMRKLQSYWFSVAVCVLSMLSLCTVYFWILALPLGIWGLLVLRNPQVRALFNEPQQERESLLAAMSADLDETLRIQFSARLQKLSRYLVIFNMLSLVMAVPLNTFAVDMILRGGTPFPLEMVGWYGAGLVSSALALFGAWKMRKRRSYWLSVATCIVTMWPMACFFPGFAFGSWGLVVLADPRVRSLFTAPHVGNDTDS